MDSDYFETNSSIENCLYELSGSNNNCTGNRITEDVTPGASIPNRTLPIDMQFNSGHVVSISVYSVLFVLSAIGNITVLTAILRQKRTRESLSRIDLLLVHLAVADLMVTFFMMPLEIGWNSTVYWRAGDTFCRIMSFFRIFGLFLSGFVLVCLAIDRYLAVRYPMQSLASNKRAKMMLLAAWVLSCACSFPQMLIFHVESHPEFPWYTQCVTFNSFSKPEYDMLYRIFGMVMMYALPLILLVVLYGSIAVQLYKMSHTSRGAFGSPDGLRRSGVDNIERAKVKSIQMTFVITAAFLICWTPYYVMVVWYMIDNETAVNVDWRIQKGLFLFASTNSTFNPIVYGIFHFKSFERNRMQSRETAITIRSSTTPLCRAQNLSRENSPNPGRSNSAHNGNTQITELREQHYRQLQSQRKNNSVATYYGAKRESVPLIIKENGESTIGNDARRASAKQNYLLHSTSKTQFDSQC